MITAATESDVERDQETTEAVVGGVDPNSVEGQALLQSTLDEGQIQLMQMAAQVGLNNVM